MLFTKISSRIPFSKETFARNHTMEDIWSSLGDKHRNFAEMWDNPFRLRIALETLGDVEVLFRLACFSQLQPVKFLGGTKPFLLIQGQ